MLAAVVFALALQQAAPGPVVWETPRPPTPVVEPIAIPEIPDWARADPLGYERSECSPLMRSTSETMEACQARVRAAVIANLGAGSQGPVEDCTQQPAGDRFALQCGAPSRADRPVAVMSERTCETRPQAQPGGGVNWVETCRQDQGRPAERDGLTFRLGGRD